MSQADYIVDNGSGAVVRADINVQLAAIATNNSGTSAPTTTYPRMWWPDETNGRLKQRNAANTAWVDMGPLDVANMGHLVASNNLSDLASAATARTNLGVYSTAQVDSAIATLPQNSKSAAYTLVLTDAGKHIYHPSADTTARIWTIPANASVAFPIGTCITMVNDNSGGAITIAITSDTLRWSPSGATGSRTLAANGVATILKVTSTSWFITGTGLS